MRVDDGGENKRFLPLTRDEMAGNKVFSKRSRANALKVDLGRTRQKGGANGMDQAKNGGRAK